MKKIINDHFLEMMRIFCLMLSMLLMSTSLCALQLGDSASVGYKEKIKSGWNFGGIPIVAYNSDMGFQFGAQGNLYDYGNGTFYPDYKRSIKLEASYYTKGTGAFQIMYDDKYLLPKNIRLIGDISYISDRALDFYGFNGAMTVFDSHFSSKNNKEPLYISRMFYKYERKMFRTVIDLQQNIGKSYFKWMAGVGIYNFSIDKVNINHINKNLNDDNKLPQVESLYETYCKWGIISQYEKNGGLITSLRFGAAYDSRDIEANPTKGVWTEVMFNIAPAIFSASKKLNYGLIAITHRQYISLIKNHLTLVYRLAYQGNLFGEQPYFMQPLLLSSYNKALMFDGIGGAKSVRGILRDRIIGSHIVYGNIELRYKFWNFNIKKQNFYLTFTPFLDYGSAIIKYKKNEIEHAKSQLQLPVEQREEEYKYSYKYVGDEKEFVEYKYDKYFTNKKSDNLHLSYGVGVQLSMNQNFVISISYGRPFDKNDGKQGLYFNTGFIF